MHITDGFLKPTEALSGLAKYHGNRQMVASKAILDLLATAATKGVYQPSETYRKWAINGYRRAWKKHAAHVPYEQPPDELIRLVRVRTCFVSLLMVL
jgi:hypothetical protein